MTDYRNYITTDPQICHGQPCFKGTRILVYLILEAFEAGETPEQILESYPNLTKKHIQATLHMAAEMIKSEEFFPLVGAS